MLSKIFVAGDLPLKVSPLVTLGPGRYRVAASVGVVGLHCPDKHLDLA